MAIAEAGQRLVVVGERGIVLLSDNGGASWRQASVPVSVSLTGVQFVDPHQGWAIGHGGVVLHSVDGGETWTRQLDGRGAAQLAMEEARSEVPLKPGPVSGPDPVLANATQLVSDGPDKPFLDLKFTDSLHGFIVGAYGLIFRTDDGGRHWRSWIGHVDNPQGLNLYAVSVAGPYIYLAGEQGFFARSEDGGRQFVTLPTPHQASYFAMDASQPETVLIAGLRGNAFRSTDAGQTWQKLGVTSEHSFTTFSSHGGQLLLADDVGEVWLSNDEGASVMRYPVKPARPVTGIVVDHGSTLLTVGPTGVHASATPIRTSIQ